jgi:integrase
LKPLLPDFATKSAAQAFQALDRGERVIAKLCIIAGLRPGEVFALRWGNIAKTSLDVRERVYEGVLASPKSERGTRNGALADGLIADIEEWKRWP